MIIYFSITGAMGSRSHIDIILNGYEESQDDPLTNQAPATAKSSQGRTKNFSSKEDILLVLAWLNVGMDAISGVDQSQGTYWRRIHEYFHANKSFESTRTEVSLINRWSTIQHDVNTFCGCVTRIEDRNQSGCSVDDKVIIFLANKYIPHYQQKYGKPILWLRHV